jgi:S1-C subfamily serine protease
VLRGPWLIRVVAALLLLLLFTFQGQGTAAQGLVRRTLRDYEIVNGYFFTQTGGSPDQGYSITDENGIPRWQEYQRLGGPDVLGYPISQRFQWHGFVVQATQKAVLQWQPELGRVVPVNLLDELSRAGKDDWLLTQHLIPRPEAFPDEAGLTFHQVVDKRLQLLDPYPALRTAFLSASDPLESSGLPVAPVADVGPALVLRAQRRAFQLWKVDTPFAQAGQVTVVNGGDLGKEATLFPAPASQPEPAWRQIATPPGSNVQLSPQEVARLRQVIEQARPAVVKLTDGAQGLGSGIIFDPSGLILTNSHVVVALRGEGASPRPVVAVLTDGRQFPVHTLGADDWTDIAVVKIEGPNLPAVPLGTARSLAIGERVIGLGYAPIFPAGPSAKTGTISSLDGQIQTSQDYPQYNLITTNTYLHPGDSGGPLLNLGGHVVGVNNAIRISRRGQELYGFSIPVDGAFQIAQQIIASGKVPRPHLGVSVQDVSPSLAASLALSVRYGVLVTQVTPESPAAVAGLVAGDVIVSFDRQEVASVDDLYRLMVNHKIGDTVPLGVISPEQPRRTVTVTLTERPPLI